MRPIIRSKEDILVSKQLSSAKYFQISLVLGTPAVYLNDDSDSKIFSYPEGKYLTDDIWQFLAIAIEDEFISFYLNGNLLSQNAVSLKYVDSEDCLLVIGAQTIGNNGYYNGFLYMFSYFSYKLTQNSMNFYIGSCASCNCPSSINSCLSSCNFGQYFYGEICNPCP